VRRRRAVGFGRSVFRRGTCDKEIWTKSVAIAADAEELISTEALVSEIPEEKKVPAGGGHGGGMDGMY
jgi:hypothetical protein